MERLYCEVSNYHQLVPAIGHPLGPGISFTIWALNPPLQTLFQILGLVYFGIFRKSTNDCLEVIDNCKWALNPITVI